MRWLWNWWREIWAEPEGSPYPPPSSPYTYSWTDGGPGLNTTWEAFTDLHPEGWEIGNVEDARYVPSRYTTPPTVKVNDPYEWLSIEEMFERMGR